MSKRKVIALCALGVLLLAVILIAAIIAIGFGNVASWVIGAAVVAVAILFVDLGHSYDQNAYYDYGGLTKRHKDNRKN